MPFSVLLLTAANSERHISGYGGDRVTMKDKLQPGEVVLFFDKVDSDIVKSSLNIMGEKCCDGIIFYSRGNQKVICLVEMKTSNLGQAEEQIKTTHTRLAALLRQECKFCEDYLKQVIWRAYIYRSTGIPSQQASTCVDRLLAYGFKKGNVVVLGNPDITTFLRK